MFELDVIGILTDETVRVSSLYMVMPVLVFGLLFIIYKMN